MNRSDICRLADDIQQSRSTARELGIKTVFNIEGFKKGAFKMNRKINGNATIKTVSEKTGIPESNFRNPNGRKTRNDKKVRTMRKGK